MAEVRHFTLDAETRGLRLDQALARLAPDHSRSFLAGLIEQGQVSIDGRKVTKPSQRLPETGRLTLEIPDVRPIDVGPQELPLTILYQDDDLAVIDKPAGLVVHPASGH